MARARQPSKPPVETALVRSAVPAREPEDSVEAHVESSVAQWPQIDPEVEAIVIRLNRADRYLVKAATVSLDRVGLAYEEFKVLILLHDGPRSHGSLCRELLVSSGVMTNRLDKLERAELLLRKPDPSDWVAGSARASRRGRPIAPAGACSSAPRPRLAASPRSRVRASRTAARAAWPGAPR
jgi:MarR family